MKTVKTSELIGAALDWAVAKCVIIDACKDAPEMADKMTANIDPEQLQRYSTDWAHGGPIIDLRRILLDGVCSDGARYISWSATVENKSISGPTPLIAAMRCYVAHKLGDTVEVPDELV